MKKILFFNHASEIGGAGMCFLHLMLAIDKSKYDVVVYCSGGDSPIICRLEEMHIRVIRAVGSPVPFAHFNGGTYQVWSKTFLNNIKKVILDRKRCIKVIAEEKPDIIAVNSMTLFWIGKLAKKYGAKTVCFHRETFAHGLFGCRTSFIKQQLDCYFDRIAFISNYDMKATDLHRAKGFVIHDKVDLEAYDAVDEKEARKTLNLDSEHIYGLYVGGYSKLKGFHILMDAIADIQDPRLRIIVIGCSREDIEKNGTKHAHLIFKAYDRCRNFEHVLFYPISNQIQLFFKACDFVIVPSTLAHQARPIYEAGAAGKPLIISDYPNLYEFLTEYGMNYMFPPNDSAMLGLKINELTADLNSGKVKEMLIKARYLTEKKHSLKTLQDEMDKLFYEI